MGRLATHALGRASTQGSLYGGVYSGLCTTVEIREGAPVSRRGHCMIHASKRAVYKCLGVQLLVIVSQCHTKNQPTIYLHDRQASALRQRHYDRSRTDVGRSQSSPREQEEVEEGIMGAFAMTDVLRDIAVQRQA